MEGTGIGESTRIIPRAARFPIQTLLHFRGKGEEQWREGETVNISRSGLLFRSLQPLSVKTPVEMSFELPVELSEGPAATVICRGEVVRTVLPAASDESPVQAATIRDYRLVHRSSGHEA
jgi:PilZ domain